MSSVSIESSSSPEVETVVGHTSQFEVIATDSPENATQPARDDAGQTSCEPAASALAGSTQSEGVERQ